MVSPAHGREPEFPAVAAHGMPKALGPDLTDGRFVALCLIRGAFQFADLELTWAKEEAFDAAILQAYRVGVRGADELAFRALETEGYKPSWRPLGEIATIALG